MNMLKRMVPLLLTACAACCLGRSPAAAQVTREVKLQTTSTGRGNAICGSCSVPKGISPHVRLAAEGEAGEPLVLSGTIYKADGVTPDSGVTLFLYQTDAGGYYHRPEENVFQPRIRGWLRTGIDGHYEIQTIKPAPEVLVPDEPAHIHVQIFGNGMPEHFVHEFWVRGDRRISAKDSTLFTPLGKFSPIISLTRGKDGVLRGVRDFRVRPAPAWNYEEE
jgi:protocatechuate 3,4-dioxygenase beta subunit